MPLESAEGSTRHASFPVLAEGQGSSFSTPRKISIVKSEDALLSREMPAESARRADWSDMMSHIYLEFVLVRSRGGRGLLGETAQGPRGKGWSCGCVSS